MKTLGINHFANLWDSNLIPIFKAPGETENIGLNKNYIFMVVIYQVKLHF